MRIGAGEQRLDNLLKRDLFCKLRDGDEFPEEVRELSLQLTICCDNGQSVCQLQNASGKL